MPIRYQFLRSDGTPASLAKVDDEVCAYFGFTPHKEHFSSHYEALTTVGIAVCWHTSKATVEELEKYLAESEMDMSGQFRDLLRKFLIEDYTFTAWRA